MDIRFVCMFIFPPDLYIIFGCSLYHLVTSAKCNWCRTKKNKKYFLLTFKAPWPTTNISYWLLKNLDINYQKNKSKRIVNSGQHSLRSLAAQFIYNKIPANNDETCSSHTTLSIWCACPGIILLKGKLTCRKFNCSNLAISPTAFSTTFFVVVHDWPMKFTCSIRHNHLFLQHNNACTYPTLDDNNKRQLIW